jgi:hypothetical protein
MFLNAATRSIGLPVLSAFALCIIASCVESRHPLSSPEEGFVDPYLRGTWRSYELVQSAGGLAFVPADDQDIIVLADEDRGHITFCIPDEEHCCPVGHSTLLEGNKYLSLGGLMAKDCEFTLNEGCPYVILKYETFASDSLVLQVANEYSVSIAEAESVFSAFRGRLLVLWNPDLETVQQAIRANEISGEYSDGAIEYACLTADSSALQDFISGADSVLFTDSYSIFVRKSSETDS